MTPDGLEILKRPCISFDVIPLQMLKLVVVFRVASAYNICGSCFMDMDSPTTHSKRAIFVLCVTIVGVDFILQTWTTNWYVLP
jgi:hypothetical protein